MRMVKTVSWESLYFPYKEDLKEYYEKYFATERNNPLWFYNSPICRFAEKYLKEGRRVLDNLDQDAFIKYEYDRYKEAETVKNDTHKTTAALRVIDLMDSILKHGYCKGSYDKDKHLIRVTKGFISPYGNDSNGYTLHTRKHRAACCVALKMDAIKVLVC